MPRPPAPRNGAPVSRTATARMQRPDEPRTAASGAAGATHAAQEVERCRPGDTPLVSGSNLPMRAAVRRARAAMTGLVTVTLQQRAITPPMAADGTRHRRGHDSRGRDHPARGRDHSPQGSVRCLTMRRAVAAPDRTFRPGTPNGPCQAPDTPPVAAGRRPVTAVTPPAAASSAAGRTGRHGVWISERTVRRGDSSGARLPKGPRSRPIA